ncbi:hypothetical protein MC885_014392 [Smutsia gigantea]|nr:hypothetical protein MC885_014392 [Smutsia gigantea]
MFSRLLCGSQALKSTLPPSFRYGPAILLGRILARPLRLTRKTTLPRGLLRRRNRKRRTGRVSLRAEPSAHGTPSVVPDEAPHQGQCGWGCRLSGVRPGSAGAQRQEPGDPPESRGGVPPPAIYQFSQYVCEKTGLKIPQVPRAGSEAKAWQKGHVSSGWPSLPRPSSPAWCPPPGGRCCCPSPKRRAGAPGPSPFTRPFSPPSPPSCQPSQSLPSTSESPGIQVGPGPCACGVATGIITVVSALSVAPAKAREYSREGWEYLRQLTK